jgi:hypothetical protein
LADDELRFRLGRAARSEVLNCNSLSEITALYEDAIVELAAGEHLGDYSYRGTAAA